MTISFCFSLGSSVSDLISGIATLWLITKSQKEIDELWAEEAEARVGELGTTEVRAITGEDIRREIREKLTRRADVRKLRNFGSSALPNFGLNP